MEKYNSAQKLALLLNCAESGIQVKDIGEIEGYESYLGKYFVLSSGEVWSQYKGDMLKPYSNEGYLIVDLRDGENRKQARVHRLVALAFLPNPDNLETVNHKDEDITNNELSNLEWMSVGDNVRYGTGTQRAAAARCKPVECIETGVVYASLTEAAEAVKGNIGNLSTAIKNHWKHRGYTWRYVIIDEEA